MHSFLLIASILFAVAGSVQLFRYYKQMKVKLGTFNVPLWVSAVAGAVLWLLAIWGFLLTSSQGCGY